MSNPRPLEQILKAALGAVDAAERLRKLLRLRGDVLETPLGPLRLLHYRKIWLLSIGKAAVPMATALEEILGARLERGQAVAPTGNPGLLFKTRVWSAGHPEPNQAGAEAAASILDWLRHSLEADDLLILALSGGGSALFPAPAAGVSLEDKQVVTRALLRCGATIQEINTLRKHLSRSKGGRLLESINGAEVLTLAVSDVVGDDLSSIASGPAFPDSTSYRDCLEIVARYQLEGSLPAAVLQVLEEGVEGWFPETLKAGDARFERVRNLIVASNRLALEAAAETCRSLGYRPLILTSSLSGDNRQAAGFLASLTREVVNHGSPLSPPCCLLAGGECTVRVSGTGKGGRNQDMALEFSRWIDGWPTPVRFASVGTDGIDGPTEAAGARVSTHTQQRARKRGLDVSRYLADNDSYHFFRALDDLILTGPTQTNVMDIQIILIGEP